MPSWALSWNFQGSRQSLDQAQQSASALQGLDEVFPPSWCVGDLEQVARASVIYGLVSCLNDKSL